MKRIILFLLLLSACQSVEFMDDTAQENVSYKVYKKTNEPIIEKNEIVPEKKTIVREAELATKIVTQKSSQGRKDFGFSEDGRLLRVDIEDGSWDLWYENGTLVEITGPKRVEFRYVEGLLSEIKTADKTFSLTYDSFDRLVELKGGSEPLRADFDGFNNLRVAHTGTITSHLRYNEKNNVNRITKGSVDMNVVYDDKDRVRNFNADSLKFILGYWRDDKLISLSGNLFGGGLTVSYGIHPPREAQIIFTEDDSSFKATETELLYTVVDNYLYCNYVRNFGDLLFENIGYAFYVNYFGGTFNEYIIHQFACLPYEK
ncbi:hypothetical protein COV18_03000 [Candidatus Woesearchaeota archaeon CG10_big_fil_rev_8_21_14_0_10_37_12]|nr:MAG: hypothetical protein COV18_03000 [Candidatus Woesearchaeota archaeon CG10_big_fil_rev_8_21_14_0_10_37_12]